MRWRHYLITNKLLVDVDTAMLEGEWPLGKELVEHATGLIQQLQDLVSCILAVDGYNYLRV
jgi:hypothetical protein